MTKDELEEQLRQLENRMVMMEKLFETQGAINGKLLEGYNALLIRVADMQPPSPAPSLILPN